MCHRPECISIPRCQTQYGGRLEDDNDLNNDLAKFVSLNLKRMEILDFLRKDYPMYAWSLRSLARRMQYFGIQFTDYDVEVNDVEAAVEKEISGPGKLLGYRAMHKKIREIHGIQREQKRNGTQNAAEFFRRIFIMHKCYIL